MFSASTKDGPVRTAWPPPMSLPLLRWSHSDADGQVPLDVGLLIDGELDATVADGRGCIGAQVERHDLNLAARLVDGVQRRHGDRRTEGDDVVDAGVLLELRCDRRLHRRLVLAVDLNVLGAGAFVFTPAQRVSSDRAGCLDDAERLLPAGRGDARADDLPGEVLVRPEVIFAPSSLYWSKPC